MTNTGPFINYVVSVRGESRFTKKTLSSKKYNKGVEGGQKTILRRHNLWTAPDNNNKRSWHNGHSYIKPSMSILKVSKFQKQIFLFSIEPKNEQNYFLNSALASKMSQIKKKLGHFIILFRVYLIQYRHYFSPYFRSLGPK